MSRISVCKVPGFEYPWWATWEGQLKPKVFPTWRDAMECADKQARTREVVLPRCTTFPTPRHHLNRAGLVMEGEQSTRFPHLPPKYLTVHPDELRPLALALLALAEKEEACGR